MKILKKGVRINCCSSHGDIWFDRRLAAVGVQLALVVLCMLLEAGRDNSKTKLSASVKAIL